MSSNEELPELPRHVVFDRVSDKIIMGGCPILPGKMFPVNDCIGCKYHDGFAQFSWSDNFPQAYRVMCCHAVLKEVRELA